MIPRVTVFCFVASMVSVPENGDCAEVLYVAPFPALSHYQMLEPLMVSLAKRGHHVTVLSHFPPPEKIPNYTHVDLGGTSPLFEVKFSEWNLLNDMVDLFDYGLDYCRRFSGSDVIQEFVKAPKDFDLIVLEAFDTDCYLGFVARYKRPFIVFSAMPLPVWQSDWILNPTEVGHLPDTLCRLWGDMDFKGRLRNVFCHLFFRGLNWSRNSRPCLDLIRKNFHVDVDNLKDIKSNVSLIFVNSFPAITGVRSLLPNVLEIGGIHIKPPKPLPHNIETFLNGSPNGAIAVSMGSIVKFHSLDSVVKYGFASVLSKVEQRVLWKCEVDLPDKPVNLMTVPWFPQADVLGHPSIRLFICHGGIHGIYEAVHNGVPVIGIPLYGDQLTNLKILEMKGVAIVIEFSDLNERTLSAAITEMLTNESYARNAKKLSRIFRDQPQTPLEKAVFWTEYVIRHGGAPHIRNGASELSWLQYFFVDVLSIALFLTFLFFVVFYNLIKFFWNYIF